MENNISMIHTVPFSKLNIWDVKSFFHQADVFNKKHPIVLFGEFLTKPQIQKIKIEDSGIYKILGARSYGKGVFVNRIVKGSTLKMRTYHQAKANHLFWCKVDTKNGAFGIITKDLADGVGSSNMTFAKIETDKANPEYLQILFRSKKVNEYMDGYVSGTTNRKYIKPDQLREEIKISLPILKEQNRIVANYNKKINLAEEQKTKIIRLQEEVSVYVDNILGIKINEDAEKEKVEFLKIVRFKDFHKWGVDAQSKTNVNYQKDFTILKISEICDISSGGTPSRTNPEFYNGNIPWIKTGEVINDIIYDTEEKITEDAIKNSSAKIYKKGSLIIAMYGQGKTRGRTAKLGVDATTNQACAVLHNIDNSKVLTDYLWIYLMNEYDRLRELASGNNQPNLNGQMIKNYPVVLPKIKIQEKIIIKVSDLKNQIKELTIESEKNMNTALFEFEKEIFKS
jgi:restriction endonuclease S subunit